MSEKPMTPEQAKKARKRLGLNQPQMGEALGRSERIITYRESGVHPINNETKYAIYWLLLPEAIRSAALKKILRFLR